MGPIVERVLENLELGEGPHWDSSSGCLYFIDAFKKTVERYDPKTKKQFSAIIEDGTSAPAFVIPVEGRKGEFVVALDDKIALISWNGSDSKAKLLKILAQLSDKNKVRFNDGKADSEGRLWTGTMEKVLSKDMKDVGSCYSLEKGTLLKKHFDNVTISNGIAFDLDAKRMYYIDTAKNTIDQFDLDIKTGTISNRRVIFTMSENNVNGSPDGQVIDSDGNLWVACFGGSRVIKIDPRRPETLLETITLPAIQITSVQFGGENLDELYVTTACINLWEMGKPDRPANGSLYKITNLGTKGVKAFNVKIG